MNEARIEIPARRGKAAFVAAGETVTVINTHGEQVVDTWAFSRADLAEFMSNEHSRAHTLHLVPKVGDVLRTNRRRPILTLTEDTSGGVHDTLIAACDRWRYAFLGVEGHHDNCTDNLFAGMAALGLTPPEVPSPLNLFMNIPWGADGTLGFAAPPQPTQPPKLKAGLAADEVDKRIRFGFPVPNAVRFPPPLPLMLIEMRSRPSARCSRLRMNVAAVPSI